MFQIGHFSRINFTVCVRAMLRSSPWLIAALTVLTLAGGHWLFLGATGPSVGRRRGYITRQLFSENLWTRRSKRSLSTWYGPPVIPDGDVKAYEREVYFVVVRFVLQMLHFAVGVIDERALFGKDHKRLQRSALNLTPDMIDFAMREVVVPSSRHKNIISAKADEILYKNAVKFALRLVIDMVASVQLSGCGLRIRLQIEADPGSAKRCLEQYPLNLAPFEKSCEPLVKELLSQRSIPLPEKIQEDE
eukprot:s859_g20.t1